MASGSSLPRPDLSPDVRRALGRSMAILGAATFVTAIFSEGFFHQDEHYQIVEWVSYQLGVTELAELPWEHRAQIRPWLQPLLYTYFVAKPLVALGVQNPFVLTYAMRLVTAALAWLSFRALSRTLIRQVATEAGRLVLARQLSAIGFLPYLFVRTSSETASTICLHLALALLFLRAPLDGPAEPGAHSLRTSLLAGLALGLAFEFRYQTAFFGAALVLWLGAVGRMPIHRLAAVVFGGLCAVGVGTLCDRIGYGTWVFVPYRYFDQNIVQGVASSYGRDPIFAYPYLVSANIFFPLAVSLLIATFGAWIARPKHALSLTTFAFVLSHSLVAHKEERFLFPIAPMVAILPFLWEPLASARTIGQGSLLSLGRRLLVSRAVRTMSLLAMLFLAVYPLGFRVRVPLARRVHYAFPEGIHMLTFEKDPSWWYPFYWKRPFRIESIAGPSVLTSRLDAGPVYFLSDLPVLPEGLVPATHRSVRVASEAPMAQDDRVASGFSRFALAWNGIRTRGAPLPELRYLTLHRIEPAKSHDGSPL